MYSPGKVFVRCAMGASRSGALVLASLVICQGLSSTIVRLNRDIGPNSGFLELELSLRTEGERERQRITVRENRTMVPSPKPNKGLHGSSFTSPEITMHTIRSPHLFARPTFTMTQCFPQAELCSVIFISPKP